MFWNWFSQVWSSGRVGYVPLLYTQTEGAVPHQVEPLAPLNGQAGMSLHTSFRWKKQVLGKLYEEAICEHLPAICVFSQHGSTMLMVGCRHFLRLIILFIMTETSLTSYYARRHSGLRIASLSTSEIQGSSAWITDFPWLSLVCHNHLLGMFKTDHTNKWDSNKPYLLPCNFIKQAPRMSEELGQESIHGLVYRGSYHQMQTHEDPG